MYATTYARIAVHIGQLIEGEGRQIEARHHALSQLSRLDLASRGLNRPCGLNELMSHTVGRALTGR
jgi:hypothetical protein